MIFAKAYFNTPSFTGDVFYRFEDDTTPAKMLILDYIGSSATSFEEIDEDDWTACEGWAMYVAYPEFGHTFIFAVDTDLAENEEVVNTIVSNVPSWGLWSGAVRREETTGHEYDYLSDEKCIKLIEDEVAQRMIELGFARVEDNGEIHYNFGSVDARWKIQKELLKERFGRDWLSPQDRFPNMFFD